MTEKTLINICGSERSGSTMLDLILGNDPSAFSCGEIYALYRPWRKHHFQPTCGCGKRCDYLEAFKNVSEDQVHQLLFERFGFSWIVDSSKDLSWVIDNQEWVIRSGGRVLNLVIWKQPETFTVSFLKRGHGPDYWRRIFIGYYKKFLEADLPFASICYDDFVNDPQRSLGLICDLVGMDNFAGKMNFWEKTHHQLFGSGGTARQVQEGSSRIFKTDDDPARFEDQVKATRDKLAEDIEVVEIIRQLQQKELTSALSSDGDFFNVNTFGRKPVWYYRQKLALKIKRFCPDSAG